MICEKCGNATRRLELFTSAVDHCDYCEQNRGPEVEEVTEEILWPPLDRDTWESVSTYYLEGQVDNFWSSAKLGDEWIGNDEFKLVHKAKDLFVLDSDYYGTLCINRKSEGKWYCIHKDKNEKS